MCCGHRWVSVSICCGHCWVFVTMCGGHRWVFVSMGCEFTMKVTSRRCAWISRCAGRLLLVLVEVSLMLVVRMACVIMACVSMAGARLNARIFLGF